jgi:hypothetical protein
MYVENCEASSSRIIFEKVEPLLEVALHDTFLKVQIKMIFTVFLAVRVLKNVDFFVHINMFFVMTFRQCCSQYLFSFPYYKYCGYFCWKHSSCFLVWWEIDASLRAREKALQFEHGRGSTDRGRIFSSWTFGKKGIWKVIYLFDCQVAI